MRALRRGTHRLAGMALAGLFLVLVANTLGLRAWPFELLSHFTLQYLLGAGFLCLFFVFAGKRTPAAAALILVLAFTADYQQAPQPVGNMTSPPIGVAHASVLNDPGLPSHRLSLLTQNVWVSNRRTEEVIAWLSNRPADIIALVELPDGMAGMLKGLKDVYPHQFAIEPGAKLNSEIYAGDESLAILSIHPISAQGVVRPSGQGKLSLLTKISVPDAEDPWFVLVHPSNPTSPSWLAARDAYLLDLAGLIAELAGPVIVAGDFNVTPYAPVFRSFLSASRTSTSREFPATWPSLFGPLGIPIDHVLVREARLTHLEAFGSVGSDHRALKAEILLPASTQQRVYAARPK